MKDNIIPKLQGDGSNLQVGTQQRSDLDFRQLLSHIREGEGKERHRLNQNPFSKVLPVVTSKDFELG